MEEHDDRYFLTVIVSIKTAGRNKTGSFFIKGKKRGIQTVMKSTIKELLKIGLEPMGSTMYVWGGGWNETDDGAGKEARTLGVSGRWREFFRKQDAHYDYRQTRYQIHEGLDCSGYVGWCIYNLMHTKNGEEGYVMPAKKMAADFARRGWGTYFPAEKVEDHCAGDIMSSNGHVYLTVGSCRDGSVVLMHSSPPGVQLSGTTDLLGRAESEAVCLAEWYMKNYFPAWHEKYPDHTRGMEYLREYSQMRWLLLDSGVISDPEGLQKRTAEKVLAEIFGKQIREI